MSFIVLLYSFAWGVESLHVRCKGRLGNQLFQAHSAAGIASSNGLALCVTGCTNLGVHFENVAPHCSDPDPSLRVSENGQYAAYHDWKLKESTMVEGYLQSFRYFPDHHIRFKPHLLKAASEFNRRIAFANATVGIHVRHGDLLKYGYIRFPPASYFVGVLDRFRGKLNHPRFIVVSDEPEWCLKQSYFQSDDIVVVSDSHAAAFDMAIVASCDHIALTVGTFGWWAAYLGAHSNGGNVVYYADEFVMDHPTNRGNVVKTDYYPENWVALGHNSQELEPDLLPRAVVTGASSNHFDVLLDFLRNVQRYNSDKIPVFVYDLGLLSTEHEWLSHHCDCIVRTFAYQSYPEYFNVQISRGEYAWKPVIIKEMLDTSAKLVLWLDAGDRLTSSTTLPQAFQRIASAGFLTTRTSGTTQTWVHPDTRKFLKAERMNAPMCNGAIVGFDASHVLYDSVVKPWQQCALTQACIAPFGSSRANHRQDQAVLTVLLKQASISCVINEGTWSRNKMMPGPLGIQLHQDETSGRNPLPCEHERWCGGQYDPDQKRNIRIRNDVCICPDTFQILGAEPKYAAAPLHGRPDLRAAGRQPPFVRLIAARGATAVEMTVVMPAYNAAAALEKSLPALLLTAAGLWDLVIVLDGCHDSSYDTVVSIIRRHFEKSSCQQVIVIEQPTAVWETSSDNIGMRASFPTHAFILLQSDMIMTEHAWNQRMLKEMKRHSDCFALSARCGHSFDGTKLVGRCNESIGIPLGNHVDRNVLHWRETVNRGPLMLHANRTRVLGYLDETKFFLENDDHDLMRRARKQKWLAAYLPVDFVAPLNLSTRHNPTFRAFTPAHLKAQEAKYKQYREQLAGSIRI